MEELATNKKKQTDIAAEQNFQYDIDETEKRNFPLCFAVRDAVRNVVRCTERDENNPKITNYLGKKCVEGQTRGILQTKFNRVIDLIDKNPTIINETNERGESPLFIAGLSGNLQLVDVLISRGATISIEEIIKLAAFNDMDRWIEYWLDRMIKNRVIPPASEEKFLSLFDTYQELNRDEIINFINYNKHSNELANVVDYLGKLYITNNPPPGPPTKYQNIKNPNQSFMNFFFEPGFDGGKRKRKTRKYKNKKNKNKKRFSRKN